MVESFNSVFITLDEMGVLDSLLPFILIFTLLFAILQKTQIIGEGRKNFNVTVATVMSMMVVIPHVLGRYPEGQDPIVIINTAIPNVSIVIVAILCVLLLIGVFGNKVEIGGTGLAGWVAMLAFGTIFYIFGSAAGWFGEFPAFLSFLNDPDTQALVVMLAVFAIIIRFITADDKSASVSGPFANILNAFRDSIVKKP